MAKSSFSFRIDSDNLEFIDSIREHGDAPAFVVNHAIRMFRKNLKTYANMAHFLSPTLLFDDMEEYKIGDKVVINSPLKKHYNLFGHIGEIVKVYRTASVRSYDISLSDGRRIMLPSKYFKKNE